MDYVWCGTVIVGLSPIWGAFLWHTYEFSMRRRLIPQAEIDRLVAKMLAKPDPEEAAFAEEHAAWYRGETFEQGKWRRVRKAVADDVRQQRPGCSIKESMVPGAESI